MAELLKTTILGFLSITRTTLHSSPLITELEFSRTLNFLNSHDVFGPDRLFPRVLKALSSHIAPVLARMLKLSLPTVQVSED